MDDRLLHRLDWFLVLLAGWLLSTLVLASFALMIADLAVGLLALGTVTALVVVWTLSYRRSTGGDAELRIELR